MTNAQAANALFDKFFKGRVFTKVTRGGSNMLEFTRDDGARFALDHEQDCCESVWLDDVTGDLDDLVGEPLLVAEEVSSGTPGTHTPSDGDSCTWTFYKFATRKGYVDLRFCGESNGYYSERVDLFVWGTYTKYNWTEPRFWCVSVHDEDLLERIDSGKGFTLNKEF